MLLIKESIIARVLSALVLLLIAKDLAFVTELNNDIIFFKKTEALFFIFLISFKVVLKSLDLMISGKDVEKLRWCYIREDF